MAELYLVTKSKFSGKRINLSFIKKDLRLFIADFIMFSETSTPTTNPPKSIQKGLKACSATNIQNPFGIINFHYMFGDKKM